MTVCVGLYLSFNDANNNDDAKWAMWHPIGPTQQQMFTIFGIFFFLILTHVLGRKCVQK